MYFCTQTALLSLDNIHVLTSYYEDKIADFLVVSPPRHGALVLAGPGPASNVTIFSVGQLRGRQIKVRLFAHELFKLLKYEIRKLTPPDKDTFDLKSELEQ